MKNVSLQWGRARMSTEGNSGANSEANSGALQWGRARMSTEGVDLAANLRRRVGFNGAVLG